MWHEIQFEVFGTCDRRCPYCDAARNGYLDVLPDHAKFDRVVKEVYGRMPRVDNCALVGGEPSFWPYELQARFITTMRLTYRNWTVFTNGRDMDAPLLNVPGWTYTLHLFGGDRVPNLPPNWRAVTVESPIQGATNYVDSGKYRNAPAPQDIAEARKSCDRHRIARIDIEHGVVYPCCKSAHGVPYSEYRFFQPPVCDDCVPFGMDTMQCA